MVLLVLGQVTFPKKIWGHPGWVTSVLVPSKLHGLRIYAFPLEQFVECDHADMTLVARSF